MVYTNVCKTSDVPLGNIRAFKANGKDIANVDGTFYCINGHCTHKGVKDVWLRPETTGKETQWGDLKECIRLSQDIEGVLPCVDFAHLHARYNGINNTTEEFRSFAMAS